MGKRSNDWHITGWMAFALIPVVVPVILLLKILGIGQTVDRTPAEVADYIRDFIEGTGGDWDWDDFTSVTIKDPVLDSIRDRACCIDLPVNSTGLDELKALLAEAEALVSR
jgi:hypothetical protein